jgi:hypothetical protein
VPKGIITKAMKEFILGVGEKMLMRFSCATMEGESGALNVMRGSTKITDCTGTVTSKRFVACRRHSFFPWGPVIWAIILIRGHRVVFEIPLGSLAAIEYDEGVGRQVILRTTAGEAHRLVFDGLADRKRQGIQAISDAWSAAFPGKQVKKSAGLVEFDKP